jgi:predicted PolB exonuclease-like 3'-5' exonuclease
VAATLVFDIETIPDVQGIRSLHGLPEELSGEEVAEYAFQLRRASGGSDFLPHHLQRVVTISCVLRDANQFRVFSLSEPECSEGEIIQRFFEGIEKFHSADRCPGMGGASICRFSTTGVCSMG